MSKTIEAQIECPFYIQENTNTITCEGLFENTSCTHKFKTNKEKKKHEKTICSENHGKKCFHHRMLSTLYERGQKK